jgi:hypothetical protein
LRSEVKKVKRREAPAVNAQAEAASKARRAVHALDVLLYTE